jgi:hypothetical protein
MRRRDLLVRVCLLGALSGCPTKRNPAYCEADGECSNGYVCDLNSHGCVIAPDAQPPDARLAGPKAYVADNVNGIYQVERSATGDLSLGSQVVALGNAYGALTSKDGKQLFVLTNESTAPTIHRYEISATDGTLNDVQDRSLGSCVPFRAGLHPSGNYIVVGCTSASYSLVPIDPTTGELGNIVNRATGTAGYLRPVFTPDGGCMFLADIGLYSYSFDVQSGGATPVNNPQVNGPPVGIGVSADGSVLYLADDDNIAKKLTPYQIATSCNLTQQPAAAVTISGGMQDLVVHPDGTGIFVFGPNLYAFNIAAGAPATLTAVTNSPFTISASVAFPMKVGVIDPQYLAGSDTGGPYTATLNANAFVAGATLVTGGSNTTSIAVAP